MTVDIYAPTPQDDLSATELDLYHLLMEYRAQQGLAPIPLSQGLTLTAGRHALDTTENILAEGGAPASLHDWSDAPYLPGDADGAAEMWDAPERLGTAYTGNGYEISAAGYTSIEAALEGWKSSSGHNDVIVNQGAWTDVDWSAIGIGVEFGDPDLTYGGRVYHVWFGAETDPAGAPEIHGTGGGDSMTGTSFDDLIFGLAGADTLDGGAGDDTLDGGAGNDSVEGGPGRDLAFLRDGDDLFAGTGPDGDLVYAGLGNDTIVGGAGNDVFHGIDGHDAITGGAGDDLIYGGLGFDTIDAGAGADTVHGGHGRDLVFLGDGDDRFVDTGQDGAWGRDTVFAGTGDDTVEGGGGNDVFHGIDGHDVIGGGGGHDLIYGGTGFDTLSGGGGNDTVWGGEGRDLIGLGAGDDRFHDSPQGGVWGQDTITGGAGADAFVFSDAPSADVITDYEVGVDSLGFTGGLWASRSISVTGDGVLIDFGGGQSVLLEGLISTAGIEGDVFLV